MGGVLNELVEAIYPGKERAGCRFSCREGNCFIWPESKAKNMREREILAQYKAKLSRDYSC